MIKYILPILLILSFSKANTEPYTEISKYNTQQLECLFEKVFKHKHPLEKLVETEITSSKAIEKLFSKENIQLELYKAFVYDYFYQSNKAEEHYELSADGSTRNLEYYIRYLARTSQFNKAIDKLEDLSVIHFTSLEYKKMIAYVYMAQQREIDNKVLSLLKRKNITLNILERGFDGCKN
ncbi:MAG: hypothetical protein ACPGUI_00390 [Halarcobacter sp.]